MNKSKMPQFYIAIVFSNGHGTIGGYFWHGKISLYEIVSVSADIMYF